jgi:transposase InsO family protein
MPNQLWVSDFTDPFGWQGIKDVAFIVDVFTQKIVGPRTSASEPPHRTLL